MNDEHRERLSPQELAKDRARARRREDYQRRKELERKRRQEAKAERTAEKQRDRQKKDAELWNLLKPATDQEDGADG